MVRQRMRGLAIVQFARWDSSSIIIIIIIIMIIVIIIINDNNYHCQNQATEWRSARSLSAGQRPASRGDAGGAAPPRPTLFYYYH